MSTDILNLIDNIGDIEESVLDTEFVSPVFDNTQIAMSVAGLVYTLRIPKTDPGWYRFKAIDRKRARIVSEASFTDISDYQRCLKDIRIGIIYREGDVLYGIPQKTNSFRIPVNTVLPIFLCSQMVYDFDYIIGSCDGVNIWYKHPDMSNSPLKGEYLRDSLSRILDPTDLKFSGLTIEDRIGYSIRFKIDEQVKLKLRLIEEQKERAIKLSREEQRKKDIKDDIEHAGGTYLSTVEGSDFFRVTYVVDGAEYTSMVSKDSSRKIISAGICLSGGDRDFDLKSLITVMREGQNRGLIHREW